MYMDYNDQSELEINSFSIFNNKPKEEIEEEEKMMFEIEKVNEDDYNYGLFSDSEEFNKIKNEEIDENVKMDIDYNCKCLDNFIECDYCRGKFYLENAFIHMEKCLFRNLASDLERIDGLFNNENSILKCQECSNYVLSKDYKEHLDVCRKNLMEIKKFNENPNSSSRRINIEEEKNSLINFGLNRILDYEDADCPLCFIKIKASSLEDHFGKCLLKEQEAAITEKFICQSCNSSILVSEKQTHLQTCSEINQIKINLQSIEEKIFPAEWGKSYTAFELKSNFLSLYKLTPDSNEYNFVTQKTQNALQAHKLQIVEIERIENKTLWRKYFEYIELIKSQNLNSNEGWLFHGTRTNSPYNIVKDGFDISFSNDAGSLGRGLYFAKEPTYSIPSYCYFDGTYYYVFLCRVHCGNSYNSRGGKFYKPPLFDAQKEIYYDSVYNAQMVVVYENHKAYPFYMIKMKKSN